MMKKIILMVLILGSGLNILSANPTTPKKVTTHLGQINWGQKVQDYLNGLTTMRANFVQISADGEQHQGVFYLKRPDKMRLDYDQNLPQRIIANDGALRIIDLKDKSESVYSTSYTPASFILNKNIRFNKDVFVKDFNLDPKENLVSLKLTAEQDQDRPAITVGFQIKPFLKLDRWMIEDQQGNLTTVIFDPTTVKIGIDLNNTLFTSAHTN